MALVSVVAKKRWLMSCGLVVAMLVACGETPNAAVLSGVSLDTTTFTPGATTGAPAIGLNYRVGREATVTISVAPQGGPPVVVRKDERRSPDAYNFRFGGAVPVVGAGGVTQERVLGAGAYNLTISATAGGDSMQESRSFAIAGQPQPAPDIQNVIAFPETITPNFDAQNDNTTITYRVTQPAKVTVYVDGGTGAAKIHRYLQAPTTKTNASENVVIFNGLTEDQDPLPNGTYTITIEAADAIGNISRAQKQIVIQDAGRPKAEITYAQITPDHVTRGDTISLTVRVKNTSTVPLRTQGPQPGYTYSTQDTFSSIENHQYDDKAGLWRIGVDFDGGGTAPGRYPFRWGFGHDLQPGEETTITGTIRVTRTEDKLRFFVGLIQEQIALPQDHVGTTWVTIS